MRKYTAASIAFFAALLFITLLFQLALGGVQGQDAQPVSEATKAIARAQATYNASLLQPPTATPDAQAILDAVEQARTPVTLNADWTPFTQDFDGVPMMLVPVGCFMMGSAIEGDEQPIHEQCLDVPFWIDRTEVTQEQFARIGGVRATDNAFQGDQRPVEQINWFEARDFCALRGSRLPTEREWEYTSGGPDALVFPWGNAEDEDNGMWFENANNQTSDVGSRPVGSSWIGALDMGGNVFEWISSLYAPYPYDATDGREADTGERIDIQRMVRGGAWNDVFSQLRAANRQASFPNNAPGNFGIRCARDV